jgi:hypothetical protein
MEIGTEGENLGLLRSVISPVGRPLLKVILGNFLPLILLNASVPQVLRGAKAE